MLYLNLNNSRFDYRSDLYAGANGCAGTDPAGASAGADCGGGQLCLARQSAVQDTWRHKGSPDQRTSALPGTGHG